MKKQLLVLMCAVLVSLFFAERATQRIIVGNRAKKINPDSPQGLLLARQQAKSERYAKGIPKPDAPDEFLKYHAEIRTRDGETGPRYPLNYKIIETEKALNLKAASLSKRSALPWVERGPGNVGGRTRALIVDPDDPTTNTWFAGGVSGGIWKSTNAGGNWINKTPSLPNLAITWLAMAASNHNVIYTATGEGFGNVDAVKGDGVWKSTNRGETWSQLTSTAGDANFAYVNRIIISPSNENTLLAATNTGVFRSTDGGSNWAQVYSSTGRVQDLVANPQNFNIQYATRNSIGVLKSTDAGVSWSTATSGLGSGGRYELAISPVDPNRVYVGVETNSSTSDLYVSDDGAASWSKAVQSGTSPNWLNGQGWYDNAIVAHPYNKDVVFVGGLDIYKIQASSSTTTAPGVTGVEQNSISSFLTFVNWGGSYAGGGVGTGANFYSTTTSPISVSQSDYVSVEIRFGPGLSQKAHRFTFGTSFVYPYLDYVTIPFQVWDVTNNRQLMVSFRDSDGNGVFNLVTFNSATPQREYVFINAVPYNDAAADPNIAQSGGQRYKNIYAFWPILPTGQTWNSNSLPSSNLKINYGLVTTRSRTTAKLTNWYANLTNPSGGTYPYVHADHHNFTIIPVDATSQTFRILNGSDGGIAISIDGGTTWSNPNTGYNTSQFYGADKRPGADQYIGGTQDNGTWLSPLNTTASSGWTAQIGGDGFMVSWHYTNADKIIGSLYYNSFRRTTNGGETWTTATTDMTGVGSGTTSPFITSLAKSNSDPDLLFAVGSLGVWRSDNFAENWTLTNVSTNWGFGRGARAAISLANPQIVWAGTSMSSTGKIHVSKDGGITFSPTINYTLATLGRLSGFATHPTQPNTAYTLFSIAEAPKILRTTDLGQTWTDISGFGSGTVSTNGFPDVATYSLLVMPHNPNEIWAGTEIGLFISTNGGASWSYANDVLPAVAIWQLSITDNQVVAATHGRGVWSVTIPELGNYTPPVVTLPPRLNKSFQGPDGKLGINISLRSSYDSTAVTIGSTRVAVLDGNAAAKDTIVKYPVSAQTILTTSVTSYKNGVVYKSSQRGFSVSIIQSARPSFSDNFDVTAFNNYTSTGLVYSKPTGFTSQAYHTPHPYLNNTNYSLTLNIPIIVQQTNAFVQFDEVVLVEPGETGSKFGDPDFWDYVIVEGSKDGATWTAIEDGYDARYNAAWLSAYNSGSSGSASLMLKHRMNLLNKFAAGDVIFIRFRLYADPNTTGWGWMFDNLEIQESTVSVENQNTVPLVFALDQNYPNPFNPSTTIRFALPRESKVSLKIYDIRGRLIQTLLEKQLPAGFHSEMWNANGLATGVYYYRIEAKELAAGSDRKFIETKKLVLVK